MYRLFIYFSFFVYTELFGQIKTDTIYINTTPCNSIEKIKSFNPDSIEAIFLSSMNLRTIPKEVLLCKNLIYLYLTNDEMESTHLNELSKRKRKKVERALIKNKNNYFDEPGINLFHPNKIRVLPVEFYNLKKLKIIDAYGNVFSKRLIRKIHKKLPNCYIMTNDNLPEAPVIIIKPLKK
jgi:hypothetical protein